MMAHISFGLAMLLLGLFLVGTMSSFARVFHQSIDLYEGYDQKGSHFLAQDYVYDLGLVGFDNKASSACASGIWLLYNHPEYNPSLNGVVRYMYGDHYCHNLDLNNQVSSVKFVGPPNGWKFDTITVYEGVWFQGSEEYLIQDSTYLQLSDQVNSAIVTGHSPWTIYEKLNYSGRSVCLWPVDSQQGLPGFLPDMNRLGDVWANSVSSVRFGCHATRNLTTLTPSRAVGGGANRMNTLRDLY